MRVTAFGWNVPCWVWRQDKLAASLHGLVWPAEQSLCEWAMSVHSGPLRKARLAVAAPRMLRDASVVVQKQPEMCVVDSYLPLVDVTINRPLPAAVCSFLLSGR
mmetsp:Transcript_18735/g.45176  ORF Transcript_18735/g.45176 Transcript_18735/m.45176 type:complete len:104 (+) Transcript_18735:161-472(+)